MTSRGHNGCESLELLTHGLVDVDGCTGVTSFLHSVLEHALDIHWTCYRRLFLALDVLSRAVVQEARTQAGGRLLCTPRACAAFLLPRLGLTRRCAHAVVGLREWLHVHWLRLVDYTRRRRDQLA